MKNQGIWYEFEAAVYHHSSSAEMTGWTMAALPKALSVELRKQFKTLEEGWGRMKVLAKVGNSEWQTAIWFDTKQETYLLPLKAVIRKKEKIALNSTVNLSIRVNC